MDIHWLLFVRYLEFFAKFQGSRKQRQQTSLSMSFAHSSTRDVSLRRGYMRVCKSPEYVRICESYVHNGAKLQKRTNICKFLCKKIIKNLHFKRKIETFAGKVSICMNQTARDYRASGIRSNERSRSPCGGAEARSADTYADRISCRRHNPAGTRSRRTSGCLRS